MLSSTAEAARKSVSIISSARFSCRRTGEGVQARRKTTKRSVGRGLRILRQHLRQHAANRALFSIIPDEEGAFPFLRDFERKLIMFIFQVVSFTRAKIRVPIVLSKKKISHFSHILHIGAFARRENIPKSSDEKGGFSKKAVLSPFERQERFPYSPSTKLNSNTPKLNSKNFLFNSKVFLFNNKSAELK